MIKLENNSHESRTTKQTREQAKSLLKQDLDLKPAIKLSKQGKQFFDLLLTLISNSDAPFAQIDSLQISLLSENLDQLQQATDSIHQNGIMIDGKKNQATTVFNSALKNVNDLLRDLNLTMNARVKQLLSNVQSGNVDDPFAELISLDQLQQATDSIHQNGIMIDGKKNQATTVFNSALKNVNDLLRDLNLTMNARVKQLLSNVQSGNVDDPFAELISDD
ncbi:P27 family phage terminase small subunit [Lactiplantibacillus plantarum]|uniref:P27 family phage terminase small subunit n=1 Tax=Lactiplantibacillus plantarum TaxID=1590 RepID=UPI000E66BE2A|nr:P27 family phage terminase small subunit [Lactiplantibacillus plantarum]